MKKILTLVILPNSLLLVVFFSTIHEYVKVPIFAAGGQIMYITGTIYIVMVAFLLVNFLTVVFKTDNEGAVPRIVEVFLPTLVACVYGVFILPILNLWFVSPVDLRIIITLFMFVGTVTILLCRGLIYYLVSLTNFKEVGC